MKSIHCHLLLFIFTFAVLASAPRLIRADEAGPTPYPDPKNEAAWPGKGPIRSGAWMTGERKNIWDRRAASQGKIVFVGDSIIGGWKLDKDFPGNTTANCGVGGDVTRGVLFRLQQDVLDLHPKAIVIEIGANDITANSQVPVILTNYNLILDQIQKANPETPIVIMALLPQGIPTGAKAPSASLAAYDKTVFPRIPLLNAELAKIPASRKNVTFVDTNSVLLLPDGTQDLSLFNADDVHPTEAGHSKLAVPVTKALTDLKVL